jgi:hypothetical protein
LSHAKKYTEEITKRLGLTSKSFVIEVAANDGYLLKNFVEAGIPCLGIEPTASTAKAAEEIGVPIRQEFFGDKFARKLCDEGLKADLIIGNNVYAHVPDINDFTEGLKVALKGAGTITLEFPHFLELLEHTQFDTVYHEHFSYLSLHAVELIFQRAGLRIWDVEELSTHGGSLRIYGCHANDPRPTSERVALIEKKEVDAGLNDLKTYSNFQEQVNAAKNNLLAFLLEEKRQGRKVAGYGAAAKGNTFLNFAGVKPDLLPYVCDAAASKQNKYLPGSHIPIKAPVVMRDMRPDTVLILPWNIAKEVVTQNGFLKAQGTRFYIANPTIKEI